MGSVHFSLPPVAPARSRWWCRPPVVAPARRRGEGRRSALPLPVGDVQRALFACSSATTPESAGESLCITPQVVQQVACERRPQSPLILVHGVPRQRVTVGEALPVERIDRLTGGRRRARLGAVHGSTPRPITSPPSTCHARTAHSPRDTGRQGSSRCHAASVRAKSLCVLAANVVHTAANTPPRMRPCPSVSVAT